MWVGRGVSRVGVGADAKRHLVNYSACLGMSEAVAVLEERGGRARGEDGVGVVRGSDGATGWVGQQGVCGQGG